jgi:hypothetical protein
MLTRLRNSITRSTLHPPRSTRRSLRLALNDVESVADAWLGDDVPRPNDITLDLASKVRHLHA